MGNFREIYSFYLSEKVYFNRRAFAHRLYGNGILARLRNVGKTLLLQFRAWMQPHAPAAGQLDGKIWIFYNTKNQLDTLHFLTRHFPDAVLVSHDPRVRTFTYAPTVLLPYYEQLPWRYLPRYLRFFLTVIRDSRHQFLRTFHYLMEGVGQFEVFRSFIERYRPRMIVMANDHSVHCRAMMFAGNDVGVPTVFFQHASIAEDFPPMRFQYACLEGQDTLDKYLSIDSATTTQFSLVGMPKFDAYFAAINTDQNVRRLGIPYNLTEDTEAVLGLVTLINEGCSGLTIRVRKHPGDRRAIGLEQVPSANNNRVERSDPATETPFAFLNSVDMIVCGSSSIHLEAVLMNVVAVYYSVDRVPDAYGYVTHGLVDAPGSVAELLTIIRRNQQRKQNVRDRAQYYYAPLNTAYDGRAGELSYKVIEEILLRTSV